MDQITNLSSVHEENESSVLEQNASFILVADLWLASFSVINLIVNFALLCLSAGFICGRRESSGDTSGRLPHYGLHFFIFNCVLSSFLLECIGSLTNVGFVITGDNIFLDHLESQNSESYQIVKKVLDFLSYAFFNVSHLNFVLLLNVDKLLYILRPLHYHAMMSRKRVWLISGATWLVALAMASPCLTATDMNTQIRQEAIVFSLCVVCPASFDLLSAIIVSTLVYRIQLRDSHTRRSIRPPSSGRRCLFFRHDSQKEQRNPRRLPNAVSRNISRHCRVFFRSFMPIIWTCVTTVPFTGTMIYIYFGADNNDDFIKQWTDITNFKMLRLLGCLYVIYFTGVPFLIVFNNKPYRHRIRTLANFCAQKLSHLNKPKLPKEYSVVSKSFSTTVTDVPRSSSVQVMANKQGYLRNGYSCTEV